MNIRLSEMEARVIGALIEKQVTTPDQYPLSLNALVNACNQKSNREPVMQLDESVVKAAVDGLGRRHMVIEKSGYGSRVPKYHQIFCNTEFGSLKFTPLETAIICELLLRGPQTPGELRSRVPRMADLPEPAMVEAALEVLAQRVDGPFVVQLAREPGRRDSRWMHLFSDAPVLPARAVGGESTSVAAPSRAELLARIASLEEEIVALRARIANLGGEAPD